MTRGQKAPRTVCFGLRARAWWVMRAKPTFTLTGLLMIVASGAEANAASNLGKYVRALARVGILRDTGRARPKNPTSNGEIQYRLCRNTGPAAPVWRRDGCVFDPNTGELLEVCHDC